WAAIDSLAHNKHNACCLVNQTLNINYATCSDMALLTLTITRMKTALRTMHDAVNQTHEHLSTLVLRTLFAHNSSYAPANASCIAVLAASATARFSSRRAANAALQHSATLKMV
ncbi:MAG: hypothetical protein ACKPKO_09525, partial [Candidatus Fonsibacter sp.]